MTSSVPWWPKAAATSLDREAEWVRLSANLAEDDERKAMQQLQRLTEQLDGQPENADDMEPLERIYARIARNDRTADSHQRRHHAGPVWRSG